MPDNPAHTNSEPTGKKRRALLLYYSFSGQTSGLLNHLASGLKEEGVKISFIRLRPASPLRFPVGSFFATFRMMLTSSLRWRVAIKEPEPELWADNDLIILAGPTWSYNPSGPILDLIDRFGPRLFKGRTVLPLISCRGYWRLHWLGLKRLLEKCGADVPNRIVFSHPSPEPWRTLGVFLKIAGKAPERSKLIGRYYQRYGHSRQQLREAEKLGAAIGACLRKGESPAALDLLTPIALP
ncbi:MAG: NAD(P)H-dependent oxidoreductase [Desulfurivibrionaceae bacterium]|nr:NAD(P)H-dependent oxidoreductase [Desulfobulbales bacterium]MDT8335819.1 NAD(P)H-dependent oxidoreductase [Desulfurivibrionaceae bacterium]